MEKVKLVEGMTVTTSIYWGYDKDEAERIAAYVEKHRAAKKQLLREPNHFEVYDSAGMAINVEEVNLLTIPKVEQGRNLYKVILVGTVVKRS
jgi:hypothetical protein